MTIERIKDTDVNELIDKLERELSKGIPRGVDIEVLGLAFVVQSLALEVRDRRDLESKQAIQRVIRYLQIQLDDSKYFGDEKWVTVLEYSIFFMAEIQQGKTVLQ